MICRIGKISKDSVIAYAAEELKKYMMMVDPSREYVILSYPKYNPEIENVIWVGMDGVFQLPDVTDPYLDDAIAVDVHGFSGHITGTNSRSVLIAAYRFLHELGIAFVRPGVDGEIIPRYQLDHINVSVFEAASYRHRAICIEGAVSAQNVIDTIDWMPKVGMNGYFNQFQIPFTFYERWYSHRSNPLQSPEKFDLLDAEGIMNQSIYEIKKRGLYYHAAGHGWTCEPFGIEGSGWDKKKYDIPEELREVLALVNGKRELWNGVPLNTNLCYSSERVKSTMVDAVVNCCLDKPEVDYLHVWLADDCNNHCECEKCGNRRPSDLYVDLLNLIDEALSERGITTKIVFLIYFDLLWEPIESKLNHPDRFVLMYAPITRTYSQSMVSCAEFDEEKLPDYQKNRLVFPQNVGENIARLRRWQTKFDGDSFLFDYHFMWDHFRDPGYYDMVKVLFEDMVNLDKFNLNGMVSCQNQRVYFPTGFGMTAMAAALWNKNADFDDVAHRFFRNAFGNDGEAVLAYLAKLSHLFDPPYGRCEKDLLSEQSRKNFAEIQSVINDFLPVINHNIQRSADILEGQVTSWKYLIYHAELCKLVAKSLEFISEGDVAQAFEAKNAALSYAQMNEDRLQGVFDFYEFSRTFGRIIEKMANKIESIQELKN